MNRTLPQRMFQSLSATLFFALLLASTTPALAQDDHAQDDQGKDNQGRNDHARDHRKILAGYFEEWSIYGANYNIANLQANEVADHISHLIYAFGNVTPTSPPACAIADPVAAYQNATIPSVSGKPYAAPLYGNFGAIQQLKELHPNLKVLISLG